MTETAPPFRHIVAVDWSAASTPALGADSIWVCWLDTATLDLDLTNHATRLGARDALAGRLALTSPSTRTLVAVDVSLGHPRGFARRAGLHAPPGTESGVGAAWQATWAHLAAAVIDDRHNGSTPPNDRWSVAAQLNARLGAPHFWGVPPARASVHLGTRKPTALTDTDSALAEFRLVEQRLRERGLRPFSVWQLLGAGAVGGQTLTAVPVLHHLRHHPDLAARLRVWPFETGVDTPPVADIVVAEAWPSALPALVVDAVEHPVKDARQVVALAEHLAALQRDGVLGAVFTPRLSADDARAVVDEEGWVLGVS
jgi:precorrin-8X/cobalt-precorrin-8 methylmutase